MEVKMKDLMVLLLLVCVMKCFGMSNNEIEDFSNFLRTASALDQSLKDGSHSTDEDEVVSDHAWEESGKFEGDLILNERQRRLIVEKVAEGLARNGLQDSTKRWPNNEVIYYIQREHFTGDQMDAIEQGMQDLTRASCVKFRPYKKGDRDAVVIQGSRRGCFSQVGYQGGYQVLNLSARHPVGRGCFRHGTVVHEMLHTLGFYHMQSSPDRDDFIEVKWENIIEQAKHNFRKYNPFSVSDFGVGYDYDSVLHYSRRAFSSNGQPTLVPKQEGAQIGQRIGLSDKDTEKLNKMYCDADSDNSDQTDDIPKITMEKKAKNQPFLGHGIGYHQGKVVVIKLPAAESNKLTESPPYAGFDYFSKAPEPVSPMLDQRPGLGKKITQKPHVESPDVVKDYEEEFEKEIKNYVYEFHSTPSTDAKEPVNVHKENNESYENTSNEEVSAEKTTGTKDDSSKSEVKDDNKNNESLSDVSTENDGTAAFERLNKIIQSRVYPSQTSPPLKEKVDYSEYYSPNFKTESQFYAKKIDELFTQSPIANPQKDEEDNHTDKQTHEERNVEGFHVKTTDSVFKSPLYFTTTDGAILHTDEVDSSYGTTFPFKKLLENHKKLNSKYRIPVHLTEIKDLEHKHDYRSLFDPNKKVLGSKEPHTLLGSAVPLTHPWYEISEIKSENLYSPENVTYKPISPESEKYFKLLDTYTSTISTKLNEKEPLGEYAYYTNPKSLKYLANIQDYSGLYNPLSKTNDTEDTTKPYTLFGEIVPLTKEWYKSAKIESPPKYRSNDSDEEIIPQSKIERSRDSHLDQTSKSSSENDEDESYESEFDEDSKSSKEYRKQKESYPTSIERATVENHNESNEKAHISTSTAKAPTYDVTERGSEENDNEENPKSDSQQDGSSITDDYDSFAEDMDVRLNNIIESFKKFNDFDITSPYNRREISSEESTETSRSR